ncbi:MAG: hypothetical protein ACPG1C_12770 [Alphaproteobacteria bacterium]
MARLVYTKEEILSDHPGLKPHIEAGYTLHGGIDAAGNYVSPRMLHRAPAVDAWVEALAARGWDLIDASGDLLKRENYPNQAQAAFLLQNGEEKTLWNSLTTTGIIEARGQALADFPPPDFQEIIVEDISDTATGHLAKGLLIAHGWDEGGEPGSGHGAHDAMWFAARDALFGKEAYPLVEPPESIGKPDLGREMPDLPEMHEALLRLLMDVLMIEVRAEAFFNHCCNLMRNPALFTDRRTEADLAANLVDRIRQDEDIHVGYLQVVLSELRSFTFKLKDSSTKPGHEILDPVWDRMVAWHSTTVFDERRVQTREDILARVRALPGGEELANQFDALDKAQLAAE